jgi:hypothetical protein
MTAPEQHPTHLTLQQAFAECALLQEFSPPANHEIWLPKPGPHGGWHPAPTPLARPGAHARANPLHDETERARQLLQYASRHPVPAAPDIPTAQARCGPRTGFDGRPIPPPRGPLTGLDTGGSGGSGFPSLLASATEPIR